MAPPSLEWRPSFNRASVWPRRLRCLLLAIFGLIVAGNLLRMYAARALLHVWKLIARWCHCDSMAPITCHEEFTADFLTRLLRERSVISLEDRVASFRRSPVGVVEFVSPTAAGQRQAKQRVALGQMGSMIQLNLAYSGPPGVKQRAAKYPTTVVVKSTSERPAIVTANLVFHTFAVERWIYDDPRLDIRHRLAPALVSIPRCFGSFYSEWTGHGWVMMEDLSAADSQLMAHREKDIVEGRDLPSEHLLAVVDGLGDFHQTMRRVEAEHWQQVEAGTPEESPLASYPHNLSADSAAHSGLLAFAREQSTATAMFLSARRGWAFALEHCTFIGDEMRQVGEWLFGETTAGVWSLAAAWNDWMARRPEFFSIAHGDVSVGNMMFASGVETKTPTSSAPRRPWVLFDHQLSCGSRPLPCDLAHFLLGNTTSFGCRAFELPLLVRYFRAIPEVRWMTEEAKAIAWADYLLLYRTSLLYACVIMLGVGPGFTVDHLHTHNATSGQEPVPLEAWPMGRRFVEYAKRMQEKVREHRLHELCAAWKCSDGEF